MSWERAGLANPTHDEARTAAGGGGKPALAESLSPKRGTRFQAALAADLSRDDEAQAGAVGGQSAAAGDEPTMKPAREAMAELMEIAEASILAPLWRIAPEVE